MVFEHDQRLHELVFCACSALEEEQWKSSLAAFSDSEMERRTRDCTVKASGFCGVSLDIKPLGDVFGYRGSLTQRLSVQRAATINLRTTICQVIIKNTSALKGSSEQAVETTMSRSKSLLETHKIPTLAPKRADRIRMEHALAHVWTRNHLPFPGMSGGLFTRTSMMRKLSRTSTASKSTTRTVSCASIPEVSVKDMQSRRRQSDKTYGQGTAQNVSNGSDAILAIIRSYDGAESVEEETSHEIISVKKLSKSSKGSQSERSCNDSSNSTIVASQGSEDMEREWHKKGKLRKPKTLLKSFSVEGIKGWFSGWDATNVAVDF